MGKDPSKKAPDRRRRPRSGRRSGARTSPRAVSIPTPQTQEEHCYSCGKILGPKARALFVEEEVGRTFCGEGCITDYFTPDVERLEKDYFRRLSRHDLKVEERTDLDHLKWLTLQESDEAWMEKMLSGDHRYTLISEFQPGGNPIWYICITLFLRGEPSFLFLAFPTKDPALVDAYRRGEPVQRTHSKNKKSEESPLKSHVDSLADTWTEDETRRAKLTEGRKKTDIPADEYGQYQECVDETLEEPDEVWVLRKESHKSKDSAQTYHFIRQYADKKPPIWFVIVARETEDVDEIEILDAFPTRSAELVECYRRGKQEVGLKDISTPSRLVH